MSNSEALISGRFFPASVLMWSRPVSEFLEAVARRGFRGAEVWAQHLQRSSESARDVRRRADELGLELTTHAVSYDLNPLSQNVEVREVSRRQILQSLLDAATMRARVVIVHPGHLSSGTDDPEDYWPDLLDLCAVLDERAALLGLKVGIEGMERKVNHFFIEPATLNRLASAMESSGWAQLGLTVDMAHLATFTDPLEAFRKIDRIVHVHISDGKPPQATHRPMGMGVLPIREMLKAALGRGVQTIAIEGRWREDEELALDRAAGELAGLDVR
ncbi:MAG: sugar phosphate isomerase/epimerase family protein [Trueperaceae bacterium]